MLCSIWDFLTSLTVSLLLDCAPKTLLSHCCWARREDQRQSLGLSLGEAMDLPWPGLAWLLPLCIWPRVGFEDAQLSALMFLQRQEAERDIKPRAPCNPRSGVCITLTMRNSISPAPRGASKASTISQRGSGAENWRQTRL